VRSSAAGWEEEVAVVEGGWTASADRRTEMAERRRLCAGQRWESSRSSSGRGNRSNRGRGSRNSRAIVIIRVIVVSFRITIVIVIVPIIEIDSRDKAH